MEKIKEKRKLKNFRELIDYVEKNYAENICYEYKKNLKEKPSIIIKTTFKTVAQKVKGLATYILNYEKEIKRVVIIGDNSEKWVEGYLGVATAGKIVAPMDKLLPEKEIESLLKRSDIDAVITDKNHIDIFSKLREKKDNKLKTIICMEKVENKNIIDFETAVLKGIKLLEEGDEKYNKVQIKDDQMNIMLFTSGTTDKSKIVMLTQAGIMENVYSIQFHVEIIPKDTLLSFLPIHHTFENTITILLSMYKGGRVAFCDGFLFITGRKKDIIVLRNGKNVYPQELEFLITKLDYVSECIVFPREKDKTDTVLKAKIVYDKDRIKQIYGEKSEEEYRKDIWEDIKKINKELVTYKHIKEIEITDIPMEKTTTQKIKRYVEIKKENEK